MSKNKLDETDQILVHTARSILLITALFMICSAILISVFLWNGEEKKNLTDTPQILTDQIASPRKKTVPVSSADQDWKAPDENTIPAGKAGEMIRYGKDLIANTAKYFGPNGSVAAISNGMNCQNCHLQGGTKIFGNNYAVFFTSYPKKSNRSGQVVPASNRIAECFERSLAGKFPDASGKEVQAMLVYLKWVGSGVKKGDEVFGTGFQRLKYMDRPADPQRGKMIYASKCVSCHGEHGEGVRTADQANYTYPPLWGEHSYNDAAGMYRLSNFAGFVKNNMPFGATYKDPQLTDEESWDLAAFVNSQPRKHKDQHKDYPDLTKKPIDAPFGPYGDQFTKTQHKYGPYQPIADYYKSYKK
ncbi:thiosulfate dehydrogenase [Pedobacter cryoconitis]|uniref:Thiosulfate dehydrogenase n=1 Tax=Pedobacter cryoconitis TaxID=188932 RepID=A0A7W8ZIC1_9SPHI|nr:c-type cytochrome [Pedobacter cryoconitis]MBB5634591.1 thiosulfate dehydrogenase [Pedobacter cryoconitis]MBB6272279.1 thiosulfate dehydrogenase [Pedobacter cryoconitis]